MKRKKPAYFLFAMAIFICLPLISQENSDQELDKKYTPNQNSIFNSVNNIVRYDNTDDQSINNSVRLNLLAFIRQKVVLAYERKLFDGLTINLCFGKAFGNDILQSAAFKTSLQDLFNPNKLGLSDLAYNSTYQSSSALIMPGIRYYFTDGCFEGVYMEALSYHESMYYQLNSSFDKNRVEGETRFAYTINGFFYGFGVMGLSGKKRKFVHEFFINGGIKRVEYPVFNKQETGNYLSATRYTIRKSSSEKNSFILAAFNFGYALGFGF